MRIILLNRFFHPDISPTSQLLSDLAFHLAERHDVHVITSRLKYDRPHERLASSERTRGVQVHRVWTTRFGRDRLAGRAFDYATFYMSSTLRLFSLARRGDIAVALTDPPLLSVAAALIARLRGARLINWLQDLFPEVATELDFRAVPGWIARVLASMRDRSLRSAERNVALGERMAATLDARGLPREKIRVIHNWSSGDEIRPMDPAENLLRRQWSLDGKFVVGYSGNMGRAHDLEPLLEAAGRLRARREIAFLLIGGGNQRGGLEAAVRSRRLDNVIFQPYQPREMLAQSLTAPDCHVVSLKPSLEGLIVPSKIYSSMAAGRPVIFLGGADGEVARIMRAGPSFGVRVAPDDSAGLAAAIETFVDDPSYAAALGANGRRAFEDRFDRPLALAAWTSLLEEAGGSPVRR